MPLQLRDDLSYCSVDDQLIFLDIGKDRYFRLAETMERRFKSHQRGQSTDHDIRELINAGLIVGNPSPKPLLPQPTLAYPERSAMELSSMARPATIPDLIGALWAVGNTHMQLKTRRLSTILSGLSAYRLRRTYRVETQQSEATETPITMATAAFLRARPYVPIETCCLIDSISLIRFLANRGYAAHLVFAVTAVPFTAHCWAQAGALVLNDTVGNAHAHTPIRIV